jgi:peptide chain release factor subunit 1
MAIPAAEKYKLKKLVKELGTYKGRGTELVTVYVPSGYDLNKINQQLSQEQGTATNIKSKQTRDNVISSLTRMLEHLKQYKRTPANGLAIFSGNVAEREGQSDVKVWCIEPPTPLQLKIYRCDKLFVLEPLEEMVNDDVMYGLVVFDRRDATLGLLKGKSIVPLRRTHSEVPGKTKAGGQSAARFSRIRDGAVKDHYKKIAEFMKNEFLNLEGLKGILVGGPGVTVTGFMNKDYLTADVKNKIIGTRDMGYTDDFGLQELLNLSQDVLATEEVAIEKKIMQKFFHLINTNTGMVSYGSEVTKKNLERGAVEVLLLSEKLDDSIIEEFEELALTLGTEVKIISTDTSEGVQLKEMGGVAAINRYSVEF